MKRVLGASPLLLALITFLVFAKAQIGTPLEARELRGDNEIVLWENVVIRSSSRYSLGSQEAWDRLRWDLPQLVNLDGELDMDLVRLGKRIEHLEFFREIHLGIEVYLNRAPGSYERVCKIYRSGTQLEFEIKDIDGDGMMEIEIDKIQCGDNCEERVSILKYSKARKIFGIMFSEAQEEPVGSMIKDLDGDGYMETFIRPYFYLFGPLGYARKRVDFDIRRGDIKTIGELRAELFPL